MVDSVRTYLAAPRQAVLSTIGADGGPHQTLVDYWLVNNDLYVNAQIDRVWAKNLRRHSQVSILVYDADNVEHWVGIKGSAKVSVEGQEAVDDAVALALRHGRDPGAHRSEERVSFRIEPLRIFEYRTPGT